MQVQTNPPRRFNEKEAAAYLGCSYSTLRRRRNYGRGPRCSRHGDIIRYDKEALDAFLAAHTAGTPRRADGLSRRPLSERPHFQVSIPAGRQVAGEVH